MSETQQGRKFGSCAPSPIDPSSTFERECVAMIRHLEQVHLVRAQQRLEAAEQAVATAKREIQSLHLAIQVHREVRLSHETRAQEASDG